MRFVMSNENDEARMTNVEGMTKPEIHGRAAHFVIRHSFIVSSFVIRASLL